MNGQQRHSLLHRITAILVLSTFVLAPVAWAAPRPFSDHTLRNVGLEETGNDPDSPRAQLASILGVPSGALARGNNGGNFPAGRAVTAGMEEKSVEDLVGLLTSDNLLTRLAAIGALGRIGSAAAPAVLELIATLDDQNSYVRWAAAGALGRIGPAAVDALTAALDDQNENQRIRRAVAGVLRRIRDRTASTPPEIAAPATQEPDSAAGMEEHGVQRFASPAEFQKQLPQGTDIPPASEPIGEVLVLPADAGGVLRVYVDPALGDTAQTAVEQAVTQWNQFIAETAVDSSAPSALRVEIVPYADGVAIQQPAIGVRPETAGPYQNLQTFFVAADETLPALVSVFTYTDAQGRTRTALQFA